MEIPPFTNELAEFVGILLGDGYISQNDYEVKISLDKIKDKEYVFFVKNLIFNLFNIQAKAYPRSCDGTTDIRISNKEFHHYLTNGLKLQQSPKFNRAIIPNEFYNKECFYPFLLRGYFDTDGCITDTDNNGVRYPRVEMKICKSPMQSQYIKILKNLGIRFGSYRIENEAIRIQINGKNELKKWMLFIGSDNLKNIKKAQNFKK